MSESPFFEEEYQGFTIRVYAEPEYMSLEEYLPEEDQTSIDEMYKNLDMGYLVFFTAEVSAWENGIKLSSDYLGGCLYDSYEDFIDPKCYYGDMRDNVIEEAKKNIRDLYEGLNHE